MDNKLIITKLNNSIISAFYENEKIAELDCIPEHSESILGNIYIGKVKNIVKNIQAAFVEIENGIMCYYPLADHKNPIYVKKGKSKNLEAGDELLVQINREAIKTKEPSVTSNLNFTGKYVVLTTGNKNIGVSSKIEEPYRSHLKEFVKSYQSIDYGFVIRTNAKLTTESNIKKEIDQLVSQYEQLMNTYRHRTCFSLVHSSEEGFLAELRNSYMRQTTFVITDIPDIYKKVYSFLNEKQPEDLSKLVFYEDKLLPLPKLYNLEKEIQNALREKVWLKSGAYLVIQPTEAFTVIDVNSGKYIGKKKTEETFLKINLEAAEEVARQLRLRNISGIIIVDFIDMELEESKNILMERLLSYLKKDPVQVNLIDMTALNLVEITRKKRKKPLREQFCTSCSSCHGAGVIWNF